MSIPGDVDIDEIGIGPEQADHQKKLAHVVEVLRSEILLQMEDPADDDHQGDHGRHA